MIKDELQNIIHGKGKNSQQTLVQTIASYLRTSEGTSTMAENDKQYKNNKSCGFRHSLIIRGDVREDN